MATLEERLADFIAAVGADIKLLMDAAGFAPPANTVAPTITGSTTTGSTLTAHNGTWTGSPTSYAYQWQEDISSTWTDVFGETASTYVTDHDGVFRLTVVATNAYGTSSPAASSSVTMSTASETLATFNPSATGSLLTLSNSNKTATKASGAGMCAYLQGYKGSGKYWVEMVMGSGSGSEYSMLGFGNASADPTVTPDSEAGNSYGIYSDNTSGAYSYGYNNSYGAYASGKPFNGSGSVMCGLFDCDNRQFFMYVKNGATGAWITADPNVDPEGGEPFHVTGDIAPMFSTYYPGQNTTLRTPDQFTETGVCPAGVTMGWYTS